MTNTIGPVLPPQALTPSYSPLGRPVVGLESADAKNQALPPVEESGRSDKNRNQTNDRTEATSADTERRKKGGGSPAELTDEERAEVHELAASDREVRAHEAAHAAVGGNFAGSPSFRFAIGPDGVRYAVGGEVSIALEEVPDDPAATIRNAQQVQAAALAPAKPSTQDLHVAAAAAQLAVEAQLQLAAQRAAAVAEASGGQQKSPPGTDASSAFKSAQSDQQPGALLDQRI